MPQLIEHIDAIARRKARDVLYAIFRDDRSAQDDIAEHGTQAVSRETILAWLDACGIGWAPCGPVADPGVMRRYDGRIYIDVPFDHEDPTYRRLHDYLENPDGTMVHRGVLFCYYPLQSAMDNAHHDAPGFWERWAEEF